MKRRTFLTHGVALAASAFPLTFVASSARASNAITAGHRVFDFEPLDSVRGRTVPMRLYLPQRASPAQPAPLVVFSHGLGGSREGYRYLGSHWADEGIASLHPQHVGSDRSVWRGNPLELVQRLQAAAREDEALARVLDLRFAIDQILASEHAPLIQASRIAAAGHSYGANTALLASGVRIAAVNGNAPVLRDARIRASILISTPPLVGYGPPDELLGSVSIPTLHVTSLEDTINIPGFRSTVEDRLAIFDAMRGSPRTLAVFNVGGHSIFTDRITRSGPEISSRIKEATRELTTVFLRQVLGLAPPHANGPVSEAPTILEPQRLATRATHTSSQEFTEWQRRHQDILDQLILPGERTGLTRSAASLGLQGARSAEP